MILTGIIIPQILLIAFRRQLFDSVDKRKIHQGRVPRLGGIAFVPSILLSLAFVAGCGIMWKGDDLTCLLSMSQPASVCFCVCALMTLYLVGMADDLIGVKYRAKFVAQIIAAMLIVGSGLYINNLDGLFGIGDISGIGGQLFTILIIVFIINSINLIDGLDGLASGLSAMALLCFGTLFLLIGHYLMALLAFATLGSLVPFFFFNVMGSAMKKKKIFMGDTGALTIGLILAVLAVKMTTSRAVEAFTDVPAVVLAFAPLLLPCFDVVRVFVHRVRMNQNPFLPDRSHIHHKLLALGLRQRYALSLILLMSLAYTVGSILLSRVLNVTVVLAIDFATWIVLNYLLTRAIERRKVKQPRLKNLYTS